MDKEKIIYERLDELQNVLQYDTCSLEKHLSTVDRIFINQERGSLFNQLSFLNGNLKEDEVRQLKVSNSLQGRIEFILTKIRNQKHK